MYIYHADKNSLPQQVQENLENIQKLAGVVREIYTTTQELDSSAVAIGLSATTINVDTFTTGYLVDPDGDVFNIENIENDIVYISYIMTVRGAQGAQGEKGDTGATGATGAQGAQGEKGDAGEAATISVGSVTTLAAGSDATVTNVGTTSAAVLNFGIPQGADGSVGALYETVVNIYFSSATSTVIHANLTFSIITDNDIGDDLNAIAKYLYENGYNTFNNIINATGVYYDPSSTNALQLILGVYAGYDDNNGYYIVAEYVSYATSGGYSGRGGRGLVSSVFDISKYTILKRKIF